VEKGEAGHHRKYRGKPTIIVKALEKVGEDPDKRIAQGEPIGQRLMEKLTKVIPEIIAGPAKASAKKPKAEKKGPAPKAAKEAAASMRKAMKKDKKTTEIEASYTEPTGSKVKQGPITKKPKGKKVNDKQETLGGLMAEAGMIKPDPGLMAAASQVPAAQVNQT
jgi:predicted RNase H-like nuclease